MERLIGFAPSIDENCTTIILGSMPSVKSLEQQQYYAHPQNRFWKLISTILNVVKSEWLYFLMKE